jgi:hypothetical protein
VKLFGLSLLSQPSLNVAPQSILCTSLVIKSPCSDLYVHHHQLPLQH